MNDEREIDVSDEALQRQDEQEEQHAALEALRAARALGLPDDKCMALAYSAGIANDFYKEIRQ